MSLIRIANLTFGYDGSYDTIFDDVSLELDTDWKLGFIGRNGRGKTTFLRLLLGDFEYRGNISATVTFDYFPYTVPDPSLDTIDLLYCVRTDLLRWRLDKEMALLKLPQELLLRPFATLSNGEQTKILLASLFAGENRFLLIDEPTNHLDLAGREAVAAYLRQKRGFILISHDRAFLDQCVDHILSINKADIVVEKGNYSSWQQNKDWRDGFELRENEKLRQEIHHLTAAARRTSDWSQRIEKNKRGDYNPTGKKDKGYIGHQAAKMMKRSKTAAAKREKTIAEKEKLLKNIESSEPLRMHPRRYHSATLLSLADLTIRYDERDVCRSVNFDVVNGDRIALRGPNGCGKSSILKLLLGEQVPYRGQMRIGSRLIISYIPQDTSFLRGSLREYARQQGIDETIFKANLRKLDFSHSQFDKDMGDFSAGQQKKVLLAKSLCEEAHLFVWDEPLNYIDVISREQIEDLILRYQPTLLFVEHDRMFCQKIATRIIDL